MTSYEKLRKVITDIEDTAQREALLDALAEAEATQECTKCNGEGYSWKETVMTPDGPVDGTEACEWCGGTGREPETVATRMACPDCGENRQDKLIWDFDTSDFIVCDTCKRMYDLSDMSDWELRRESR
jgi:DnaJ-class molecular chaperone